MNPKDISKFDQALATTLDILPTMLSGLYKRFIEEKFTPDQALELTKTYLTQMVPKNNG